LNQLNGAYIQASNHRHRRAGSLFQGRFNAILVDRDAVNKSAASICRKKLLKNFRLIVI